MTDALAKAIAELNDADLKVASFEAEYRDKRHDVLRVRKGARNRVAELLQELGLSGFTIGDGR